MEDKKGTREEGLIEAAREFLGGYRVCEELLGIRRYVRRRAGILEEEIKGEDLFAGDETYWRLRMYEVENLIGAMPNGREKLLLYYRYIKGESVEHVSDLLGFSRRTGYRAIRRGLLRVGYRLERMEGSKKEDITEKKGE